MNTQQFLSVPENRTIAKSIILQATKAIAPSRAGADRLFIEPVLDRYRKGEILAGQVHDTTMGLGGVELGFLSIAAVLVVQSLIQLRQIQALEEQSRQIRTLVNSHVIQTPSGNVESERVSLIRLRQGVAKYFDESELRDLCFNLGVDYENLEGSERDKSRELVAYFERRMEISKLLQEVKRLRPQAPWEGALPITEPSLVQDVSPEEALIVRIPPQEIAKLIHDAPVLDDTQKINALVGAVNRAINQVLSDMANQK